tara:strand:+ start:15 stop:437 length:423 start_codon:yes stop_codon:yes gene_type:complete
VAFIQNFNTTDVDTVEEFLGFKLPLTFETLNMSTNTLESTKTNLEALLKIERGERIMQPNLGINLRRHLFQPMSSETAVQIEEDIISQIAIWMPFLQIIEVVVTQEQENNLIKMNLTYGFKDTPGLQNSIQVDVGSGASY